MSDPYIEKLLTMHGYCEDEASVAFKGYYVWLNHMLQKRALVSAPVDVEGEPQFVVVKGMGINTISSVNLLPMELNVDVGILPKKKMLGVGDIEKATLALSIPCDISKCANSIAEGIMQILECSVVFVKVVYASDVYSEYQGVAMNDMAVGAANELAKRFYA